MFYLGIVLVKTALVASLLPVCQRRTIYFIRSMAITTKTAALKGTTKIQTLVLLYDVYFFENGKCFVTDGESE